MGSEVGTSKQRVAGKRVVYSPHECLQCGGHLVPRVRANGSKETPREFNRRKGCDVCSPQKPRGALRGGSVLERRQLDANRVLRQWRLACP
jgi:hypothetical protein